MRKLMAIGTLVALLANFGLGAEGADRPNFLIVLTDDLGYGDLACYGNEVIKSPNLDRFAEEGMRAGDWKILATLTGPESKRTPNITAENMKSIKESELGTFELYNLREDIGETIDLAEKKPERLAAMVARLREVYRSVRDEGPVWPEWECPRYEAQRIEWPDWKPQPRRRQGK